MAIKGILTIHKFFVGVGVTVIFLGLMKGKLSSILIGILSLLFNLIAMRFIK